MLNNNQYNYETENREILEAVRRQFMNAARRLFGRPVEIDERTRQVFEITTYSRREPGPFSIWGALGSCLPAISYVYDRLGIQVVNLPRAWRRKLRPLDFGQVDPDCLDWDTCLERVFRKGRRRSPYLRDDQRFLTPSGSQVKQSGRIRIGDVAFSLIQPTDYLCKIRKGGRGPVVGTLWNAARIGGSAQSKKAINDLALSALSEISQLDKSLGHQQFIIYYDGLGYRFAPFGTTGGFQLQDLHSPGAGLWVIRGNTLQPSKRFSLEAIEHLEHLLNTRAAEHEFQRFFEKYPEFLLALGHYGRIHPQLILHQDDGGALIPDFFLERMDSDFCDICDLKKTSVNLVRQQSHRARFRDIVMEAIAQLTVYRDWFEDVEHRRTFRGKYGLEAFRPRVVLIIGRTQSYFGEVQRIRLEDALPSWVQLRTYDDIVVAARNWRRLFCT